ncbi:MAG: acyl carrier protein [Runella slithyformis]|nr:MAG: acyl carrier protein [Runella slithyformis]
MQDVPKRVTEILVEKLGIAESEITADANFVKDLGIDSLDYAEIVMEFEQSFNIRIPDEDAEKMWNAIFEAGAEFDIKPVGLGARDTLRLEMGYCLYGNDIDDTTSPLEAGLGWVTKFTKNFVNSEALLQQKQAGLANKLVAFELIDRGIPRGHYEICDADGGVIGHVTSGTQSPTLGKGIGLGYVPTAQSKVGSEVFIKVRDRLLKAQIIKLPFVKPGV